MDYTEIISVLEDVHDYYTPATSHEVRLFLKRKVVRISSRAGYANLATVAAERHGLSTPNRDEDAHVQSGRKDAMKSAVMEAVRRADSADIKHDQLQGESI